LQCVACSTKLSEIPGVSFTLVPIVCVLQCNAVS